MNEPGTLVWNELIADDPAKVGSFYTSLLDVGIEDMEGMPGYKLFSVEGKNVAGIFKKTEELKGMPSHWSIYFAVEDTDAIVDKTVSLGGKVLRPAADTGMGRMAVLQDPQGASFIVIAYSGG